MISIIRKFSCLLQVSENSPVQSGSWVVHDLTQGVFTANKSQSIRYLIDLIEINLLKEQNNPIAVSDCDLYGIFSTD